MIARLKDYFGFARRRVEMIAEAREIFRALDLPAAADPDWKIMTSLMLVGLGNLRTVKIQRDVTKVAWEMAVRIQEGPRPAPAEAKLN